MSFSNKIIDVEPERKDVGFKSKALRQFSVTSLNDDDSTTEGQLFSMLEVDPALDAKMHIVNNVCKPRFPYIIARVTNNTPDDRRDWLDKSPSQALLPYWFWICGRFANPSAAVRHCWSRC